MVISIMILPDSGRVKRSLKSLVAHGSTGTSSGFISRAIFVRVALTGLAARIAGGHIWVHGRRRRNRVCRRLCAASTGPAALSAFARLRQNADQ
jgi:hypothetical protein